MRCILYVSILFLFLAHIYALDNIVVKLVPNKVKTYGEPIYFNISIENIPPRGSLGMPDLYNDPSTKDGGCGGVDIYLNYSPEYLRPLGFNWSEEVKDIIYLKMYKFENGTFILRVLFNKENPPEGNMCLGTLSFVPVKKGTTTLNLSGTVSSEYGIVYCNKSRYYVNYGTPSQRIEFYPNTEFYGATVIIEEVGNYTNYSTKLEETFNESDIISKEISKYSGNIVCKVVNNITVVANPDNPRVIVKEVKITESPNITLMIKTPEIDFRLLIYTFICSLLSGVLFGVFIKLMRIV